MNRKTLQQPTISPEYYKGILYKLILHEVRKSKRDAWISILVNHWGYSNKI